MNPIINQMMAGNMQNFTNLYRSVTNAQNPNLMFQSLLQSNPQIKQVMEVINQNGGNAKQAFYNMAKQKGVDPNVIINNLKNT